MNKKIYNICVKEAQIPSEESSIKELISKLSTHALIENMGILISVNEVSAGMFMNFTELNAPIMSDKELKFSIDTLSNNIMDYTNGGGINETISDCIKKCKKTLLIELKDRETGINGLTEHFRNDILSNSEINKDHLTTMKNIKVHPLKIEKTFDNAEKIFVNYIKMYGSSPELVATIIPTMIRCAELHNDLCPRFRIIVNRMSRMLDNLDSINNIVATKTILEHYNSDIKSKDIKNDINGLINICKENIRSFMEESTVTESFNIDPIDIKIQDQLFLDSAYKISIMENTSIEETIESVKTFSKILNNMCIMESEIEDDINKERNSNDDKEYEKKKSLAKKSVDGLMYPVKALSKLNENERRLKIVKNNLPSKVLRLIKHTIQGGALSIVAGPIGFLIGFLIGVLRDKKLDSKFRKKFAREVEIEYSILSKKLQDGDFKNQKEKYDAVRTMEKLKDLYAAAKMKEYM